MKYMKMRAVLPLILIIALVIPSASFGSVGPSNESKYGMPVGFGTSRDYPGAIKIEGIYVYKDREDYIFTLVYSNGDLATVKLQDKSIPETSFFNPPDGDLLQVSSLKEPERISWDGKKIQYRIDAEKFRQVKEITVFIFDVLYHNQYQNISCYLKVHNIDFDKIPTADDLTKGYEVTTEAVSDKLPGTPAAWALKDIEELKLSGLFRDAAFNLYEENITRLRFIYLMTTLMKSLRGLSSPPTELLPSPIPMIHMRLKPPGSASPAASGEASSARTGSLAGRRWRLSSSGP